MGVPQMYYTSCEVGLAGYPGFQFNAATPGIDDGVLRRVEQSTSYEPPRSLGYQPTAEQIAGCPVNLCYLPGDGGEPAILANTAFVGTDYSHRFGNYFVHAISLASVGRDLGGALPIDFWRAAFWARSESSRTQLSEVDAVPSAAFGRASTDAFLQQSGRLGWLPRMLTAVERAIVTGGQPVILLEADSERVARWIAAICHLLPPPMARRMSFATYSFRPGRGGEHLVGTVPETDFVVDESALRSYHLFDFVDGQASDGGSHPLAELLTALGPEATQTVWTLAAPLASGRERDFADWYPLAAAGALCADLPVSADDLAAVVDWLPANTGRLEPGSVVDVAERCLDHDAITVPQSIALIQVAAAVRHDGLRAAAEICAFKLLVRDPSAAPADLPRPATESAVRHATGLVTAGLTGAGQIRDALALLTVAVRAHLPLDRGDMEGYGRDLIAPMLLDHPDEPLPQVLGKVPALRRGMLAALDEALSTREAAVLAVATKLDGTVSQEEVAGYPRLRRLLLVARAAREPQRRIPTLLRLCETDPPDRAILGALWPEEWSVDDAVDVVRGVPERFWDSPALVDRLDQVLRRPGVPNGQWREYYALCDFVVDRKLTDDISAAAAGHALGIRRARKLVQQTGAARGRQLTELVRKALDQMQRSEPLVRGWLEAQLPPVLLGLDAQPLADLLPRIPGALRVRYRERLTETLRRRPADLALATTVFETCVLLSRVQPALVKELNEVLTATVARWKSRDLDQLDKWVGGSDSKHLAKYYTQWRESRVPRGLGRFLPRRRH